MPRRRRHIAQYGAHAGAAALAIPQTVTGLIGWWDFSDATQMYTDAGTTLVTADADPIRQVNDKSGQLNHATQATLANRPLYKTGIQNSLSVARFDSTDAIRTAAFTGGTLSQPVTVFLVAKTTDTATDGYFDGIANRFAWYRFGANYRIQTTAGTATANAADTSYHVYELEYNGASTKVRIGGGAFNGPHDVGATTLSGATLGNLFDNAGGLQGDMGDALVYSGLLSLTDVNTVGAYLGTKWNLTWTTPS